MNNGTKSALASKTIQGGILAIVSSVLGIISLPEYTAEALAPHVLAILGGVFAVLGRVKADTVIDGVLPWK